MFDEITTSHYGRCVKHQDWYLKSTGVNRLYLIRSGRIAVMLNNVRLELQTGMLYLFPQNLKFELVPGEIQEVDHSFFDFFSMPAIKMDSYIQIDPQKYPLIQKAADILFDLAERYQTYPSMERNDYTDVVESYLNNLLFLMNRIQPIPVIADPRINAALEYIHRNYSREITLEDLTGLTNLEKNYFIRLFRQYLNVTPYQYIKKYRFNIALTLIKRRHTLGEVAVEVGYSDVASFSHAFKKIYGIYPSELVSSAAGNDNQVKS